MKNQKTLILGANSGIAKALAQQLVSSVDNDLIIVSRDVDFYLHQRFYQAKVIKVNSYSEQDIEHAIEDIKEISEGNISRVFICHGVLHNDEIQPEKRIEDFSADAFLSVLTANTITPMLWLKHLTPLISRKCLCKITVFTARVGSIKDNKLGGWYSYRASKTAMNMLLKSAAVELSRRAKNIKLISFHPGTTDTPLSQPFHKNVAEGKLFTAGYVASQLLNIIENVSVDGEVSYLDWEGKTIPW
mgnify:CR=1 FL=1